MPTINGPNGTVVEVTDENRLRTFSISRSLESHVNHEEGEAYNVLFSQSPTAADDCIFYMVNSSDTGMIIEGITLGFINAAAVDAEVYVQLGDKGTRNGATALTPGNLNAGSGNAADGTFEQGADLDGGVATLTGGTEIERWVFANVQDRESAYINFEQDVILPKNQTLTIWVSDVDATYYVTVPFHYHNVD